jgi:hypothetical protein
MDGRSDASPSAGLQRELGEIRLTASLRSPLGIGRQACRRGQLWLDQSPLVYAERPTSLDTVLDKLPAASPRLRPPKLAAG